MSRKPHFFSIWKQKTIFREKNRIVSRKSLIVSKKELSAQKTIFSRHEIRYEKLPFDKMKVSEKRTEPKKALTKYDKVLRIKQLLS